MVPWISFKKSFTGYFKENLGGKKNMCVSYGILSFPGGSDGKESAHSAGDLGQILG